MHALGVRVGDRVADGEHVREEREPLGEAGAAVDDVLQRAARDELHRVERLAVRPSPGVVERHDRRVLQPRGQPHLAVEAGVELGCVREDLLDRHGPSERTIDGADHATDAPATDLVLELEAARIRERQRDGHGGALWRRRARDRLVQPVLGSLVRCRLVLWRPGVAARRIRRRGHGFISSMSPA